MSYAGDQARNSAVSTLSHYLRTAFEAAGLRWDSDNQAEVEGIVDSIIDAAKEENQP